MPLRTESEKNHGGLDPVELLTVAPCGNRFHGSVEGVAVFFAMHDIWRLSQKRKEQNVTLRAQGPYTMYLSLLAARYPGKIVVGIKQGEPGCGLDCGGLWKATSKADKEWWMAVVEKVRMWRELLWREASKRGCERRKRSKSKKSRKEDTAPPAIIQPLLEDHSVVKSTSFLIVATTIAARQNGRPDSVRSLLLSTLIGWPEAIRARVNEAATAILGGFIPARLVNQIERFDHLDFETSDGQGSSSNISPTTPLDDNANAGPSQPRGQDITAILDRLGDNSVQDNVPAGSDDETTDMEAFQVQCQAALEELEAKEAAPIQDDPVQQQRILVDGVDWSNWAGFSFQDKSAVEWENFFVYHIKHYGRLPPGLEHIQVFVNSWDVFKWAHRLSNPAEQHPVFPLDQYGGALPHTIITLTQAGLWPAQGHGALFNTQK